MHLDRGDTDQPSQVTRALCHTHVDTHPRARAPPPAAVAPRRSGRRPQRRARQARRCRQPGARRRHAAGADTARSERRSRLRFGLPGVGRASHLCRGRRLDERDRPLEQRHHPQRDAHGEECVRAPQGWRRRQLRRQWRQQRHWQRLQRRQEHLQRWRPQLLPDWPWASGPREGLSPVAHLSASRPDALERPVLSAVVVRGGAGGQKRLPGPRRCPTVYQSTRI